MKKLLSVLLIFVLALSLSACNNKGDNQERSSVQSTTQSIPSDTGSQVTSTPDNTPQSTTPDTTSDTQQTLISRERAIEIALAHAGIQQSDAYDLDAELDRERDATYWEVDFESGGYDYSYEINAATEEIVISQKERD